jgi:hypothetical protein
MSVEQFAVVVSIGLAVFAYALYRLMKWYFLDSIGLK